MNKKQESYLDKFLKNKIPSKTSWRYPCLRNIFKDVRFEHSFDDIGDYPLLAICLKKLNEKEFVYTQEQILEALNISIELLEESKSIKRDLVNTLMESQEKALQAS